MIVPRCAHTRAYGRPVPNQPKTPKRGVRVEDGLWEAALREAADRGEPLSEAIRRFLERYVRRVD